MQMCAVRSISLHVGNERAVVIDALVVQEDPLGFGLLTGIDVVKALGGMSISKPGPKSQFPCTHCQKYSLLK